MGCASSSQQQSASAQRKDEQDQVADDKSELSKGESASSGDDTPVLSDVQQGNGTAVVAGSTKLQRQMTLDSDGKSSTNGTVTDCKSSTNGTDSPGKSPTGGPGAVSGSKLKRQLTLTSNASSQASEKSKKSEKSGASGFMQKFRFKKQLTLTDISTNGESNRSAREATDRSGFESPSDQPTDPAYLDKLVTSDGDGSEGIQSPRGSFEYATVSQEGVPKRSMLKKSFSISSFLDAEGGDKKSFDEKAFRHKGEQVNPEEHGIWVTCRKGSKRKKAPNQDSWYVLKSDRYAVYSVFDGHGRKGHDVSNFVKRNLPKLIENDNRFGTERMLELIDEAFEEMTNLLEDATSMNQVDANKSGTTATILIHDFEKALLTVAHCGDSGAAIARGMNNRVMDSEYLTPNHTAAIETEMQRIEQMGGRVEYDGHSYRVYLMESSTPGLNMSRSFGDLQGRAAGIISVPDMCQVNLESSDRFLLVCSDGIWEFLEVEEAAEIVNDALVKRENPAKALAVESLSRWNTYADVVDDITCIVVDLDVINKKGNDINLESNDEDGENVDLVFKVERELGLPRIFSSNVRAPTSPTRRRRGSRHVAGFVRQISPEAPKPSI